MTPSQFRPYVGMLKGRQSATISVEPAIADHEQAVVVSPRSSVSIIQESGDSVTMRNTGAKSSPYLLMIVPKAMLAAATYPIPEVLGAIQASINERGGFRTLLQGMLSVANAINNR